MPTCKRCGKESSGFLAGLKFNAATGRCSTCEKEAKKALDRFREAFLAFSQDGIISAEEWARLQRGVATDKIELEEALAHVRGDALNFLERTLAFASADGVITEDEENDFLRLRVDLAIPDALAQPTLERLEYLKKITAIRKGILPTVKTTVRLDSDEICRLEAPATFLKVNAKSVVPIEGRFVATNKSLHFLSPKGGAEIAWKNVMRIDAQSDSIYLELNKKSGNGRYGVADPMLVEATLDALTKMAKHELLAPSPESDSRHIPHDIRLAVWQRDQGKCVQCGLSGVGAWLEFDHIIPHDKGGANTINNVQLLCRRCNLTKSNRI
jgi:tellurite resistance protein